MKDAQALTGVRYDISNLADVYTAIGVIQEKLGIAGTTAKEAATTISGSAAMMKAAWQNVFTYISGGGDLDKAIDNLVESIEIYFENVVPTVERSLSGIGRLVEKITPMLVQRTTRALIEYIPSFVDAVYEMVVASGIGLIKGIKTLFTSGSVTEEVKESVENVGSAVSTADENMKGLGKAVEETGKKAKKAFANFDEIYVLANGADDSDEIIGASSVANTVQMQEALTDIANEKESVLGFFERLKNKIQEMLEPAGVFYDKVIKPLSEWFLDSSNDLSGGIWGAIQSFYEVVKDSTAWEDFWTILTKLGEEIVPLYTDFEDFHLLLGELLVTESIVLWEQAWKDLEDTLGLIAALINGDFSDALEHAKDLLVDNKLETAQKLISNIKEAYDEAKKSIEDFASKAEEKIEDFVKNWKEKISNWWDEHVSPWFTLEKWEGIFFNIGESLANAIVGADGFVEKWKTNITNWWNNDVSPWFTVEKWKGIFQNIVTGVGEFFTGEDGFAQTWKTKISEWWTNDVSPWFSKEKWKQIGADLKDGLVEGITGLVDSVGGIINKVITAFQNLVNGAIDLVNGLIGGYNKVADVSGLKPIKPIDSLNFDKYKVPALAQGAVLPPNKPFYALVGDQKHGTNIEAPLQTIVDAFSAALDSRGGTEVTVNFTGTMSQLMRYLSPQIETHNKYSGKNLITGRQV